MLPDDVWVELIPSTQMAAWRVLEAEQNPRLRLKTDINRQLSDIISLVEAKWIRPTNLIVRFYRSLNCYIIIIDRNKKCALTFRHQKCFTCLKL